MRKSLFAIGLLAISYSVQAQILCHVDTGANMYVSEGTLVYSGGGVQTKDTGVLDVHGNVMIVGSGTDAFKTIDALGADKTTSGDNIVLRLNTPATYAASTYGQLYINGLTQSNITGIVTKEYLTDKQGNGNYFQQIALPFYGKAYSSLSTELGKTFGTVRNIQNPGNINNDLILQWNNTQAKSDHITDLSSTTSNGPAYYMLGSRNNNLNLNTPVSGSVNKISGRPYATFAAVNLQNGGNIYFGPGGNAANSYGEAYNSYLQDQFDLPNGEWNPTYGKNIYQFGNPFLTNLDLSKIGYIENGTITDGNNVSNIMGIEYTSGSVVTQPNGYTFTTGALKQTFNLDGTPVGDIGLIIKPMQPFIIKLRDNSAQTLDFSTLRRFKDVVRANGTDYNVNAAKTAGKANKIAGLSVKQLGVIGLDANGNELGRAYYVVSATATTGHQNSIATTVQAAASSSNLIGTFEELTTGGYDPNYNAKYWLYINEANEKDFLGKDLLLWNFDFSKPDKKIVSYKFEIRENAEMVPAGTHKLSSGVGFFYKASNGSVQEAKQGDVIPVSSKSYNLYYGEPNKGTLATKETATTLSRTTVVYNPAISNYIVRFDPDWKKQILRFMI
ncbi:T9SS C-terminal target domain-containing protein [Chryseobacterium tructae]|uniref:T9SS C-terminal target domain-containing protein n=1 Tax=Chryseobacterium tructae TaxID=1037380 RepID=UPI0025B29B21|nr:T9SS C-terminal target domain-containing protein [Chryseobacterium tructae]MDN3694988.1 T9SS C-terminal target domain-containing protein [Chryseobacterium tructae]